MNYLAIDTSGINLTVILEYGGKREEYFDNECGVNHSVMLMPKVEELKEKLNADFHNLDFVAVVVGAGSFTGIRIGVSTVKAICFAYNLPALSLTSFDTIAYNKQKGKFLTVIDAKHGGYYVAGYDDLKLIKEPAFIDKAELDFLLKEYKCLSFEKIEGQKGEVVSVKEGFINAIEQNKDKITLDLDSVIPLYIRKSQAEEGR